MEEGEDISKRKVNVVICGTLAAQEGRSRLLSKDVRIEMDEESPVMDSMEACAEANPNSDMDD